MPFYVSQGKIPSKRHTVFNYNKKMLFEEHISREGFSGIYSNLYHLKMPTNLKKVGDFNKVSFKKLSSKHRTRHLETFNLKKTGDAIDSRENLFFNNDLIISISHIDSTMNYFYRNGAYDELLYVQYGTGVLKSNFGDLKYKSGDYIVIPKGVIWQFQITSKTKLLIVESTSSIRIPKKYKNSSGQLLESSPFCERDIKLPVLRNAVNDTGDFLVKVRLNEGIQHYIYENHPFDIIGWDGFYYPWIFNINDFEPIVGSLHQPPSVHQTFESDNFVVCSFVPRLFDFHKNAIPAPYPHSNIDSDEFIFYSKGNFMSRKGIQSESVTYHPMGLPHGPQPGKYEDSIGKKRTDELAVMIDTFKPLNVSKTSKSIDDKDYALSWNK